MASDPASPGASAPAPADDTARNAGRGGLAIAGAKVAFIVFGFAQQLILPLLIGVAGYGQVSRVLAIVSIVNNVIVATAIQGVSRAVSSAPAGAAPAAFRRTFSIHAVLAVATAAGFLALAGPIAAAVEAEHVTTPMRLGAAVVFLYGLYAPLVGSLNGQRRFLEQAALDTGYGMLRLFTMVTGALLFVKLAPSPELAESNGVIGTVVGFAAAATVIVPLALLRAGTGKSGPGGPTAREHLTFLAPLAVGQMFLNLLMQTDFMLLSRFLGQAADTQPGGMLEADSLMAAYRAVQLFSFLPYQLLMSVTFILFPLLARAKAEGDSAAVARFTASGIRLGLVLTGLMCGTVSALAPYVLRLSYPQEIADDGGAALRVLALGMGPFAVLGITSAALTSLGKERISFLITAGTVGVVATACSLLVPAAPFGPTMLVRSATGAAIGLTLAVIVGGLVLRRVAGAFVSLLTLGRVALATAVAVGLGSLLPWLGKPAVLAEAALVAAVYVVVLLVTRELGAKDLALVRSVLGKRA
jgi:stage V sporulation protein B